MRGWHSGNVDVVMGLLSDVRKRTLKPDATSYKVMNS
jgi:hypothetical protein